MNDPLEEILTQLTPRGASAKLRDETLAITRDGLAQRPPRRWDLWCSAAVAAALLLGISLNAWVTWRAETQYAVLIGPRPLPRQVVETADAIESITDPETGRWVRYQWQIARTSHRPSAREVAAQIRHHYQSIPAGLAFPKMEPFHGNEDTQVDRDRRRRTDGDTTYRFRGLDVRHQFTA